MPLFELRRLQPECIRTTTPLGETLSPEGPRGGMRAVIVILKCRAKTAGL